MTAGESKTFYVKAWVIKATYVMGVIQIASAALMLAFERTLDLGPALPTLLFFGGSLTTYQAYWTQSTPYAKVDSSGVEIRLALFAKPLTVEFDSVRSFARLPPGWLVFLARDGEETRLPLTALSDEDADALVVSLQEHLTEVSYVEA